MGYDGARIETVFGNNDNHDWLASRHGTDATDSITLDAAAFLTAFPVAAGNSAAEVPAGVEVSKAASGRYVPGHVAGNTNDGFLYHGTKVNPGKNPVAALLWHGEVVVARVPLSQVAGNPAATAPVAANHPFIRLV